jgi:outer membrane protein
MKQINTILSALALLGVIILFIIMPSQPEKSNASSLKDKVVMLTDSTQQGGVSRYAFIYVDTLLNHYEFYKILQNQLLNKQQTLEQNLNAKLMAFQQEYQAFQQKVQTGAFLSQASAKAQQDALVQKQQNLAQLKERLANELMQETQKMQQQLLDTVNAFLKTFNQTEHYAFIYNAQSFLYADSAYDITDTITTLLNRRYKASHPKK